MAAKRAQSKSKAKPKTASRAVSPRRLDGQVAIITGGSRGIGYAIAAALAAEGCSVVITGRSAATLAASAKKLEQAGAGQVLREVCDVRDPDSVARLFARVRQRFGKLDILVNNAGITQPVVSVADTTPELWNDVIATNLTGMFLCTRAALPLMRRGGTILNNLSAGAVQVFPNYAAYSAAKRGGLAFTLSLREELIPRGIRVTALMPGATATDMWDQIMPNAPREKMIPPESVAEAVLYAVLLPPSANLSEILLTPSCGAI